MKEKLQLSAHHILTALPAHKLFSCWLYILKYLITWSWNTLHYLEPSYEQYGDRHTQRQTHTHTREHAPSKRLVKCSNIQQQCLFTLTEADIDMVVRGKTADGTKFCFHCRHRTGKRKFPCLRLGRYWGFQHLDRQMPGQLLRADGSFDSLILQFLVTSSLGRANTTPSVYWWAESSLLGGSHCLVKCTPRDRFTVSNACEQTGVAGLVSTASESSASLCPCYVGDWEQQ